MSVDGNMIVGYSYVAAQVAPRPWYLTPASLTPVAMGEIPAYPNAIVAAVSGNGLAAVGNAYASASPGIRHAMYWSKATGIVDLEQLLTSLGADLTGWTKMYATDVSFDGLTIVGSGVDPSGHDGGWIATLPLRVICPVDFDASGFVDTDDYDAFIHAFELGGDEADFDRSGFVDIEDFASFVLAFEAGC